MLLRYWLPSFIYDKWRLWIWYAWLWDRHVSVIVLTAVAKQCCHRTWPQHAGCTLQLTGSRRLVFAMMWCHSALLRYTWLCSWSVYCSTICDVRGALRVYRPSAIANENVEALTSCLHAEIETLALLVGHTTPSRTWLLCVAIAASCKKVTRGLWVPHNSHADVNYNN